MKFEKDYYQNRHFAGEKQFEGFYICENCGQKVYLNDGDVLMECPRCTGKTFTKE